MKHHAAKILDLPSGYCCSFTTQPGDVVCTIIFERLPIINYAITNQFLINPGFLFLAAIKLYEVIQLEERAGVDLLALFKSGKSLISIHYSPVSFLCCISDFQGGDQLIPDC